MVRKQGLSVMIKYTLEGEVFNELVRIGQKVKVGEKVELVCWCKPYSCHGDIIKRCINWMIKENIV
jgi:hypothetical protein